MFTDIIAVTLYLAVMAYAAYSDWRTREVSDRCWQLIGIGGTAITGIRVMADGFDIGYAMMLIGSLMIVLDITLNRDRPLVESVIFYAVMAAVFIVPLFIEKGECLAQLYSIPICFVLFYILYMTGVLRGGADAKCFMVTAMIFTAYPEFSVFPIIGLPAGQLTSMMIPAFALLFHAALLTVAGMTVYGLYNICRNVSADGMGSMFWRRMKIDRAKEAHVWPKEDVIDGKIVFVSGVSDDEAVYSRLEKAGATDVWVTPIIPFMVPTFAAAVFMIFVGNLFFLIL